MDQHTLQFCCHGCISQSHTPHKLVEGVRSLTGQQGVQQCLMSPLLVIQRHYLLTLLSSQYAHVLEVRGQRGHLQVLTVCIEDGHNGTSLHCMYIWRYT